MNSKRALNEWPGGKYILALDQGTTSSRAIVYDERCRTLAMAQQEFRQHFPKPGWVEHDPEEIWRSILATGREAIAKAKIAPEKIAAIGITNQRETILVWDRKSGKPIAPAIVWQDRRTSDFMAELKTRGKEDSVQAVTGLVLDPYFSASKLRWLLNEVPGARKRAAAGELAAGTIESWLIYKLTGKKNHFTDVTNASRTMLMNLRTGAWDDGMLKLLEIPSEILPQIRPTSGPFGNAQKAHFGAAIPILSAVGDQQSALFGQLCTKPGLVKCTYGTGCFMLLFTGPEATQSNNRLLTTVAWQLGDAPLQYALEGSVFVGGAAIQWLRDGLKIIKKAPDVNKLAAQVEDSGGLLLVPAFAGMGAPHWDFTARGTLLGITRGSTAAHLARATLEGIAYQVTDVLTAMRKDAHSRIATVRVDGGASASDLLMQIQADTLGVDIERPKNVETTALGAAMIAGLSAGIWKSTDELTEIRAIDQVFEPQIDGTQRRKKLAEWRKAVQRARRWL